MSRAENIRVIAIAVLWRGDDLLVFPVADGNGGISGWRPLGGGIEPGETAEAALRRELLEEIGSGVSDVKPLAVLENIFTHKGRGGHEIVYVFDAVLERAELLAQDTVTMDENAEVITAHWMPIEIFRNGRARLFPGPLLALL